MIWLTWRQHRKQWLYTLLALAVVAAVMLPTGLSMHHDYVNSGLAACIANVGTAQLVANNNCDRLRQPFSDHYSSLTSIAILFVILPVFVGIFYGAPLVAREFEQGTHRFVWTQGVSRMRWALAKFGLIGLATLVLAVLYAIGVTWWFTPLIESGGGRMNYVSFDVQGVVPVAYTLFAVALGVVLGVVTRKVLPAMGITLAAFIAVRVAIEWVARSHYLSPVTLLSPVTSNLQYNQYANDWVYSNSVVSATGKTLLAGSQLQCDPSGNVIGLSTNSSVAVPQSFNPCQDAAYHGAQNAQLYQPGTRFWDFQWIESGIFLGLAALLIWFALVRLRRIG